MIVLLNALSGGAICAELAFSHPRVGGGAHEVGGANGALWHHQPYSINPATKRFTIGRRGELVVRVTIVSTSPLGMSLVST